ncbi:Outer membrane lipoprotein carrier protein LolA [Modicisalibacter ilicicola DSM 19980]|uniref:Outer membrane lipoprotein carrier protein LolA n=1 Tax=Modicisalibacter ilicicola DSM 19980 TaxID=1121942 RepID=A0A1M4ZU00_9GAMM|nr:outer membrane lipoprotein carrier protein LolA [Halomonas ilicicola]SHF21464.1 Outer membrane lipoprotein carrier protein LolA [Halomonas ilicicola DSM 19980]
MATRITRLRRIIWFMLLLPGPALAFELADLQDRLSQSEALEGRFEQQRYLADLDTRLISSGHFLYERDTRVVWTLETPVEDRLVFKAESLPEAAPVPGEASGGSPDNARQREQVATLFLRLLQGDWQSLRERFSLELSGDENAWQVTLIPEAEALRERLSRIELQGGRHLEHLELDAANGDVLEVRFFDQRPLEAGAAEAPDASEP